jgi:hypothetical protein
MRVGVGYRRISYSSLTLKCCEFPLRVASTTTMIRSTSSRSNAAASGGIQIPSPIAFDTKSAILPRDYASSLQQHTSQRREDAIVRQGKSEPATEALNYGAQKAATAEEPSTGSSIRLGCSSFLTIVGDVDNVQHGKLIGGVEITQLRITSRGYRMRQPGDVKLFQNEYIVRLRGDEWVNHTIPNGTRVVVRGAFSMHSTYDMVSKSLYENPVIDVGPGGYVGVLALPPPKQTESAKVREGNSMAPSR